MPGNGSPLDFNPAPSRSWRAATMHGLFEWCAQRWPDRVALRYRGQEVSYGTLNAAADGYAAALQHRGALPGTVVPVLLPRSPQLFAAMLGVLKCGAAYAALDQRWPATRLRELIAHLDGPVVVTDDDAAWPTPSWRAPGDITDTVPGSAARTVVPVSTDDACAVFFTSGTTGTPKGVLTAHRGNVRLFDDWVFAPLDSGAVMPQALAPTWDAFGLDSWGVLFNGGTLVLLEDTLELATKIRDLVAVHGVNTIFPPTAVFHSMVNNDLDGFSGLRIVGTGGEKLSERHAALFLDAHPQIPLINMYGPVESSVAATYRVVTPEDCDGHDSVPLGVPFPNTQVYVVDGGQPCGFGEQGEVVLGGDGLALGYFKDPELTARKFLPLTVDGQQTLVYHTGDVGHWSDAGLHFDGRGDRQVKIRGYRIELDDVEHHAGALPGVGSCALVPLTGPDGACEDLCLFYTTSGGADLEPDRIRELLEDLLPHYQVPALVQRLDRMPVLEDRKLDRRELVQRAAELRSAPKQAAAAVPLTGTAAQVAALFADIIGVPSVPPDASFFRLGGNSLSAAQLCTRIRRELGTVLRISQIFDDPTVTAIAGLIDAGRAG
ncbi:hypothetical protein GCM10023322_80350 [Rugosimonospora acidiphila]|uniref:Carrier domain-containing protein n=1 Tax=Rugosimonospora acidiphila TaxID=556531 RepID=A0ABP9SUS6_9ACTN